MRFGICTTIENSPLVRDAGWDFVEGSAQALFQGEAGDEQRQRPQLALPIPAANMLVPKHLKITGPDASLDQLRPYMTRLLTRAQSVGTTILVFGSGGAREVPAGFDRQRATAQIRDFAKMSADLAAARGVTIVV